MKILKASAGAGKTYRLSQHYRHILLSSEDKYPYRHILAVTFTNKATAEMKARILKDLKENAEKDPKAGKILYDILHDYSAFSVTTIDKFFQQTIRAFSRELGQFSSYQIDLDKASLINEAMDRVLDSISSDDSDILGWVKDSVEEKLSSGESLKIEKSLYETGARLKSEDFRSICTAAGIDPATFFDKDKIKAVHEACIGIIRDFESKCRNFEEVRLEPGKRIKKPGVKALKASSELAELFEGDEFKAYNTAFSISRNAYNLGLASEFFNAFNELLSEKGIMCLDESNSLLHDIIDGSDAPFVYEKTGVRYNHFLLDEFQDTSSLQWENFLPLLKESHDTGGDNLIVGDVKQSIYRWRNSDWTLLGSKVEPEFGIRAESLQENWRSCPAIVDFNSEFFQVAADRTGQKNIYADVGQIPRTDDGQEGIVRVTFRDNQMDAIVESIETARKAGAGLSDIAILVRAKKDGADIAAELISRGYKVISDDSLNLKNSVTVRRLVSLMNAFDNPSDTIGSYLAVEAGLEFPKEYHSLTDLSEALLRSIRDRFPESFASDTLFIEAFLDQLEGWMEMNGNNLREFLNWWDEKNDLYIGTPDDSSSIRIMTIHKSKGLEFPHLIFPFANKVVRYKHDIHWCHLKTKGTPLPAILEGIYPIALTNDCEESFFADDFYDEKAMQETDNINLFYVALTRAGKSLHIIAEEPTKKCMASLNKTWDFANYAELLYLYLGGLSEYSRGTQYDFTRMKRKEDDVSKPWPMEYLSYPIGDRLSPSDDATDYFGEDGVSGFAASSRIAGIVLHNILSRVESPEELSEAVRNSVLCGELPQEEEQNALELFSARIQSHPDWFPSRREGYRILNETTVFNSEGMENRPDRVIVKPGTTIIVDYKFGEEKPSYAKQIRRYVNLYKEMGYPDVSGFVWYVREDRVDAV